MADLSNMTAISPYAASADSFVVLDPYVQDPRHAELSSELRALLFSVTREHTPEWDHVHGHDYDPALQHAVYQPHDWFDSPRQQEQQQHEAQQQAEEHPTRIERHETVPMPWHGLPLSQVSRLLRVWLNECAPWLDMFDQHCVFGRRVPRLAQQSEALAYALLALSARQHERCTRQASPDESIQLYSNAISALTSNLDAGDVSVLVTACILCVLEMMSARPRDWRRHLEGCAALFAAARVHGLSPEVNRAVFWCYARMDLCSAIISNGTATTVLPTRKWFMSSQQQDVALGGEDDHDYAAIRTSIATSTGVTPDMQANHMVYLTARACDLLHAHAQGLGLDGDGQHQEKNPTSQWRHLWDELQLWRETRLDDMLPVRRASSSAVFPGAVFAHYAAISSNQLYHTACIIMLEMQQQPWEPLAHIAASAVHNALWHARRVVGISLCNPHKGNLNNAIQPLFVAGRLFSHRQEQTIVVQLLNTIESESGWAARWRIKDLETAWGYPPGTFLAS